MKHWFLSQPRQSRYLCMGAGSVLAALLLVILVSIISSGIQGFSSARSAVAKIERLLGYTEIESGLRESVQGTKTALWKLAYPHTVSADQSSADLQTDLRRYAQTAMMTVSGSQAMEEDVDDAYPGFETLTVQLSMTGVPMSIDAFLQRVYEHRPALLVKSISIVDAPVRSSRRRDLLQKREVLTVRIVVGALREVAQ